MADDEPLVRAAALGSLVRLGRATVEDLRAGIDDPSPLVRRRALELSWRVDPFSLRGDAKDALSDGDPSVVEAACFSIGEMRDEEATEALVLVATRHADPLCRESAVAALGAIGDAAGLPAILGALEDRAAIRRRAVLALASFDGDEVERAISRSLSDRDWQVRQAAEDLSGPRPRRTPPADGGRKLG